MGFRFRQSVKVLPGVRVNLSKTGMSLSAGVPGFTKNIALAGARTGNVRTTFSLPGTGISHVTEKKSASRRGIFSLVFGNRFSTTWKVL